MQLKAPRKYTDVTTQIPTVSNKKSDVHNTAVPPARLGKGAMVTAHVTDILETWSWWHRIGVRQKPFQTSQIQCEFFACEVWKRCDYIAYNKNNAYMYWLLNIRKVSLKFLPLPQKSLSTSTKTTLFNYRVNIILTKGFSLMNRREQTAVWGRGKLRNIASHRFMGLQSYWGGEKGWRKNKVRNIRLFSKPADDKNHR